LKIVVCIKQVPANNKIMIDEEKGILLREGTLMKINPYDLVALEAALQIKEKFQGTITSISMGPKSAKEIIVLSYAMGVDEGILLTDSRFAGADVYATSLTLSKGISMIGKYDLLICGRQTTDGDTGQVAPAIAEHLGITHIYGVTSIDKIEGEYIFVSQRIGNKIMYVKVRMPCVLIIAKDAYKPRLPSLRLKLEARRKEIKILSFDDMNDINPKKYGLDGSPTQIERLFLPQKLKKEKILTGNSEELVKYLIERLRINKVI